MDAEPDHDRQGERSLAELGRAELTGGVLDEFGFQDFAQAGEGEVPKNRCARPAGESSSRMTAPPSVDATELLAQFLSAVGGVRLERAYLMAIGSIRNFRACPQPTEHARVWPRVRRGPLPPGRRALFTKRLDLLPARATLSGAHIEIVRRLTPPPVPPRPVPGRPAGRVRGEQS